MKIDIITTETNSGEEEWLSSYEAAFVPRNGEFVKLSSGGDYTTYTVRKICHDVYKGQPMVLVYVNLA